MPFDAMPSPDDPVALLAAARRACNEKRFIDGLIAYDRIIELEAADARVWHEMATTLADIGEYSQACGAFRNSLTLDQNSIETRNNYAKTLFNLGDLEAAAQQLRQAIQDNNSSEMWLNLALLIPGVPSATPREIHDVRTAYARRQAEFLAPKPKRRSGAARGARLKVGYLSAFFHAANYMKPVWGLINHHDRQQFEIHLISDIAPEKGLPGYRPHSNDNVHSTGALDNRQLAGFIERLELDILVDLNSYSAPRRLGVFFEPLAPIVVAWFNAFATSGLPAVGFMVGDDEVVRPEEEPLFSEEILRLPLSYLTFEVCHPAPPVVPPPCTTSKTFTFGSLVAQYKITPPVLDAWANILRDAPAAELLLANTALKSPENREFVKAAFAERGIPADRLRLLGPAEHYWYLQYYDQIDVALDAFPYNGGTTTMEALWQGVPVLTFDGDRWASRTSQTLIRRTPWPEFVAADVSDYVAQAVSMANSPETRDRLCAQRMTMRDELAASSACDAKGLAIAMEAIYEQLVARSF